MGGGRPHREGHRAAVGPGAVRAASGAAPTVRASAAATVGPEVVRRAWAGMALGRRRGYILLYMVYTYIYEGTGKKVGPPINI